jgi:hypothetical protein
MRIIMCPPVVMHGRQEKVPGGTRIGEVGGIA